MRLITKVTRRCITPLQRVMVCFTLVLLLVILTNPVGDTAVALLKEGADFTIKNAEDELPLDLAPDKEVRFHITTYTIAHTLY